MEIKNPGDYLPPTDAQIRVLKYLRYKAENKEPLERMVGNRGEAGEWIRRLEGEKVRQKMTRGGASGK